MSNKEYWNNVEKAHTGASNAQTAGGLVQVVNKYCAGLTDQHTDDNTAFYPTGGDDDMYGALINAGWEVESIESDYHFKATAPDGSQIEYIEGDIYITPNTEERE